MDFARLKSDQLSKSVARWFSLGDLFQVGFSAVHSCGNYFVFDFVGLRLHISSSCMASSMLLSNKSPIFFWYGLAAHPALICFAQKLCPMKTRQQNQKKQLKRAGTTACMSVHILLKLKQRETTKYSKKTNAPPRGCNKSQQQAGTLKQKNTKGIEKQNRGAVRSLSTETDTFQSCMWLVDVYNCIHKIMEQSGTSHHRNATWILKLRPCFSVNSVVEFPRIPPIRKPSCW